MAVVGALACAAPVRSLGGSRSAAPDDVFSCYLGSLASMEYVVETSDRAGGLIRAIREDGGVFSGEYANQATVLIVPDADGGSAVTVTVRRVRAANGGWSSAGMAMTSGAGADLESLSGACESDS